MTPEQFAADPYYGAQEEATLTDVEFLHKRRGELVIERDRYKAALGLYPEGRDVMLAGALAEIDTLRSDMRACLDRWNTANGEANEQFMLLSDKHTLMTERAEQAERERDAAIIRAEEAEAALEFRRAEK